MQAQVTLDTKVFYRSIMFFNKKNFKGVFKNSFDIIFIMRPLLLYCKKNSHCNSWQFITFAIWITFCNFFRNFQELIKGSAFTVENNIPLTILIHNYLSSKICFVCVWIFFSRKPLSVWILLIREGARRCAEWAIAHPRFHLI